MVRKKRKHVESEHGLDDTIAIAAGVGIMGYLAYKYLTPTKCIADKVTRCPDGSLVIVAKCVDGKLIPTGRICGGVAMNGEITSFTVSEGEQMATGKVTIKNTGNKSATFYFGVSFGSGLVGADCNLGMTEVLWNSPLYPTEEIPAGETRGYSIAGLPEATVNGQGYIIKIKSADSTDPLDCLDGAKEIYNVVQPQYSAEIVSFAII